MTIMRVHSVIWVRSVVSDICVIVDRVPILPRLRQLSSHHIDAPESAQLSLPKTLRTRTLRASHFATGEVTPYDTQRRRELVAQPGRSTWHERSRSDLFWPCSRLSAGSPTTSGRWSPSIF